MKFCFAVTALLVIGATLALGRGSSDDDHESHEDVVQHHFEQAAVYNMEAGSNNLVVIVPRSDGNSSTIFAFVVVPAATADEQGLDAAEENAVEVWDAYQEGSAQATFLGAGEAASSSGSMVYKIVLEEPLVLVPLDVTVEGAYALFFKHDLGEVPVVVTSPSGIVLTASVLQGGDEEVNGDHDHEAEDHEDHSGEDEGDDESSSATAAQWANAVVASVIVSLCSLVGVFIVASDYVSKKIDLSHACIFAAGALLTASLLHIIPEALEGLESDYDNLHDMGIGAGAAILGGISLGVLVHAFLETGQTVQPSAAHANAHAHEGRIADDTCDRNTPNAATAVASVSTAKLGQDLAEAPMKGGLGADADISAQASASVSSVPPAAMINSGNTYSANLHTLMEGRKGKALTDIKDLQPGSWNLIIGDFVHNFADGVTIGAAFLGCSSTVGWTVTASTVLHEVPQELADFMALINGGMSKMQALFFNFISAISAILGAIFILLLSESLTSAAVSYILLVGAGTFVFIGLADLIPKGLGVPPDSTSTTFSILRLRQVSKLISFIVGALIIGIPLIFDQHCEAGHQGHDH